MNKYVVKLNDNDMFDLYENDVVIKTESWAFQLFNFLGERYNLKTKQCFSESHQMAVLREHINITVDML